jgi:RimJ/RimL family protein N-acetyltransferase
MFMKGEKCELRVLDRSDQEAEAFTKAINAGLTTKHLFTGSIPMRPIDIKEAWEREFKAGSVEFGIWTQGNNLMWHPDYRIFVGTCGLYSAGKSREIYQLFEYRILIFDPQYIGKGIGEEATRLVVDYGFLRLNAHRIWLGVNEANVGAIKCYEKVGFKREGAKRKELFCYGQWYDAVQMGILREEWTSISTAKA